MLVHYESGFTLTEEVEEGGSGEQRPPPSILWQYPYERLRMSADDGHRLLWLDFTDDGEQVIELSVQGSNALHSRNPEISVGGE